MLSKLCYREARYIYEEVFHKECSICYQKYATEKHETYTKEVFHRECSICSPNTYATKKHDTETEEVFHIERNILLKYYSTEKHDA
jgi:hypothetical protein